MFNPTNNLRGRLMLIAGLVTNTVNTPTSLPELDLDATVETEERTRARLKAERLERKWIQITASFSRWVSDLLSDIPAGRIDDSSCWETKRGTDRDGNQISWLGIKGSESIYIGGTEVCLDNIQFAVQGFLLPMNGWGNQWVYIDNDDILDSIASNKLRYGVLDNDGNFVEVQSKMHLGRLVALGQITV